VKENAMNNDGKNTFDNFVFSDADNAAIKSAQAENADTWESKEIKDLKGRIKDHHLSVQEDRCCYCKRNLHNEFRLVIDIEHILPKSIYPEFMFAMMNLSAACKRCNMCIKRTNTDFLVDPVLVRHQPGNTNLYYIIHPNLDSYFEHLCRCEYAINQNTLVKYVVQGNSSKGSYTYEYFRLSDFEVNSFDAAQGIPPLPSGEMAETLQYIVDLLKR
jgi:uncharacterized protein (TIGR02646 family)